MTMPDPPLPGHQHQFSDQLIFEDTGGRGRDLKAGDEIEMIDLCPKYWLHHPKKAVDSRFVPPVPD